MGDPHGRPACATRTGDVHGRPGDRLTKVVERGARLLSRLNMYLTRGLPSTMSPTATQNLMPPDSGRVDIASTAEQLFAELDREGVVALPALIPPAQLRSMQAAFDAKLQHVRFNNIDGYQTTERFRHMVEDVLLLDQGFVDLALHPLVRAVLDRYLGSVYALNEAKGWLSLPTKRDFHGWHGDAWYDQGVATGIPREVKLAFYLTDVRSGAFNFLTRSHRQQHPRPIRNDDVVVPPGGRVAEMFGAAGSAFLFDTSGIHRQAVPMLDPRRATFYNYHDPSVPLQKEDVDYYRYHPLLLNAAFLGNLDQDSQRILGFGDKTHFIPAFQRGGADSLLTDGLRSALSLQIRWRDFSSRVRARLARTFAG